MFAFLYEWIRNVAFYIVIITAVIQILPNNTYKKYIHFFTGLVLILLLKMKEIEKETEYLNEVRLEDYLEEENIEVEEIQIGAETK